jgi:hypothetical protein
VSLIDLADAKAFLDVINSADDTKLQMLLDGAEDEALRFMNRTQFGVLCPHWVETSDGWELSEPVEEEVMPASVKVGVLLLLQAAYQATPDDAEKLRRAAEVKMTPYRCSLGV